MLLFAGAGSDRLLLLLAAFALDLARGEVPAVFGVLPPPVALAGRAIGWFDHHLNRERRDEPTRRARGVLTVAVLIAGAAALGFALAIVLRAVRLGWALEALLVAVLLAQRSLYDHVAAVRDALDRRGLPARRQAGRHLRGRHPQSLAQHGV